jgi:multicomponent Na+:H+ antiporter subunit E
VADLVAVVGDHGRLRDTVEYVVREGRDAAQDRDVRVRLLVPVGDGPDSLPRPAGAALTERVRGLVDTAALGRLTVRVETFPADDHAAALVAALPDGTTRLVLAPGLSVFTPTAVADALATTDREATVELAPVGRRVRQEPVAAAPSRRRTAATFGLAYGFYLVLGDPTAPFDLVTGLVAAAVVAAVLSRVVFESPPSLATVGRALRAAVFLPYLLYAVGRANLSMAYVVLHPRLPIQPAVVGIPAPDGRLARALLANSITLTPGTLTVDVTDDELIVHTLTRASRADLLTGSMARAVRFVTDGVPRVTAR